VIFSVGEAATDRSIPIKPETLLTGPMMPPRTP